MRVVQRCQDLGFPVETAQSFRIARQRMRQDLDSDFVVELSIAAAGHLAHSSIADGRNDFVGSETSAGSKGHKRTLDYRNMRRYVPRGRVRTCHNAHMSGVPSPHRKLGLDRLSFTDALNDCIELSELAMDMVDAFSSREELIWIQNGFKPKRNTRRETAPSRAN